MRTNLEILLSDWGRRQDISRDGALGYPKASAFTKERVNYDGYGYSGPESCAADGDMVKVDESISHLHPDMRVIIIAHYVLAGPVKKKAADLRMSNRDYYYALDSAHKHLSHNMGGIYATGYEPKLCAHVAALCA